jgi:hypothetical protein
VGGLDHLADEFVCFDDQKDLDTFFIFGENKTLKAFLVDNGGYDKLSAANKAYLNRGWLNMRGYDKGGAVVRGAIPV